MLVSPFFFWVVPGFTELSRVSRCCYEFNEISILFFSDWDRIFWLWKVMSVLEYPSFGFVVMVFHGKVSSRAVWAFRYLLLFFWGIFPQKPSKKTHTHTHQNGIERQINVRQQKVFLFDRVMFFENCALPWSVTGLFCFFKSFLLLSFCRFWVN